MAIEVSVDLQELAIALKPFFAGRARGKKAALDCVDISAQGKEVEFVSTGVSSSLPAEITSSGHARIPYPFFETLFRDLKKLGEKRIKVHVSEGQIQVGSAVFKHPGISIQPIGARIADLPIDAPLLDTLALSVQFTREELMDSGLWVRVMEAEEKAGEMIEHALECLRPLEVDRDAFRAFVLEQIRQRFAHKP